MDSLFAKQERLLAHTSTEKVRNIMDKINWNNQLISIRGARGVGKSYLLKQFVKLNYPAGSRKALYCSADSLFFSNHSLLDLAESFYNKGGERLIIDEIHRYPGWSREIKEIYDSFPDLKIVVSGSSLLNIINADADLSRRCIPYYMPGLSYREYLWFYHGICFDAVPLDILLENAADICREINDVCRPIEFLSSYMTAGYYPFYSHNREDYYIQLENIVNYVVEQELTSLCGLDPGNTRKIKSLLSVVAEGVPYLVEMSKLSAAIEINRTTALSYLNNLMKAGLLNLIYSDIHSLKRLQKPDKAFLQNTNLLYMLADKTPNIGTVRETFAVSQLSVEHTVEYGKDCGDFRIDGKYLFEVGGKSKDFSQIAGIPDSFILADDILYATGHKLPLWLIGFCY